MGASQTISYNGFAAPYSTVSWSARMNYSQSGTLESTTYAVTVKGWIAADYYVAEELTLRDAINNLRFYWGVPRKRLLIQWTPPAGPVAKVFEFGPPTLESQEPTIDWGPYIDSLDVKEVTGGMAAQYEVKFTATTRDNLQSATVQSRTYQASNPLTSVERNWSFGIDQDGMTTRTLSGSFSMIRNPVGEYRTASYFRTAIVPPLPDGFVREKQDFQTSSDGLTCTFSIVDREVAATFPSPITSGDATLTSTTELKGGRVRFNLSGWFASGKNVSKATILGVIASLADSKINPPGATGRAVVESREVSTPLFGQNRVDFRFSWWRPRLVTPGGAGSPAVAPLLNPVPGSTGKNAFATAYGSAGLTEYVLQEPFDPTKTTLAQLKQKLAYKSPPPNETSKSDQASVPGSTLPDLSNDVSAINGTSPVIEFMHARSIQINNGLVVLPVCGNFKPVIQQVHAPIVQVIDSGLMRVAAQRLSDVPSIPGPPPGYRVMRGNPVPHAPVPIGDGTWSEYKITWNLLMVKESITNQDNVAALELEAPKDLRRASATTETYAKGPVGLFVIPTN